MKTDHHIARQSKSQIGRPNSRRFLKAATLAATIAAFAAADLQAMPAFPDTIRATQPDGSEIQFLRRGDENRNFIFATDGITPLDFDSDGFLRPVAPEAQKRAVEATDAADRKYLFSGAAFPSVGSPRALVILISYPDRFFSMEDPYDYFYRLLNEEGYSDNGATGSARDFFVFNSGGKFTPQFDVYGPIRTTYPMKQYGANDRYGYDIHPEEMVIEALTKLDSQVDFSIYDTDGDGQIDNVYIYYAGYGEHDSNVVNAIWPHSADILDFELEQDYYFDGVLLNRYAMSNELDFSTSTPDGIGTFVHEFSHVLGLPDLYATSYTGAFTPGRYSTLDYAGYNNDGRTPANYSIFERYCLGWAQPRPIDADGIYSLPPLHDSNEGFIIPTSSPDEFYILENRQQSGYDTHIPGHGMLAWHIDFQQDIWDKNVVNNTRMHQYVDIVEADNKLTEVTRDGDTFPGTSGRTSFGYTTAPSLKSWDGAQLSVAMLSEITESEEGVISFNATLSESGVASLKADAATRFVEIEGYRITNIGTQNCDIFSAGGARICSIAPGASTSLPAGLYIATSNGAAAKILL